MRRILIFGAGLLVSLFVFVFGVQNMAVAVGACSSGQVCGWTNANWTGTKLAWSNTGQSCTNIVSTYDNTLSSVVNRAGEFVQLQSDDTCGGSWQGVNSGGSISNLSGSGMNDNAESIDFDMSNG